MQYPMLLYVTTPIQLTNKNGTSIYDSKKTVRIPMCDNQVPIPRIGEYVNVWFGGHKIGQAAKVETVVYDYQIDEVVVTTRPMIFILPEDAVKDFYIFQGKFGASPMKNSDVNEFLMEEIKKMPGKINCSYIGFLTFD